MKSIGIILPYYGEFHNYFQMLINSMSMNNTIDFLIVTDIENNFKHGENVKFISMTLEDIRKRASKRFNMKCQLSKPYKLCDYKPAYGLIFEDLLAGYEFWGYCDPDCIYGNIRKFITENILEKYDRIMNLGHFTLYRNVHEVNAAFMDLTMPAYSYKEAFRTIGTVGFDERGSICCVYSKSNKKQYTDYSIIEDIAPGNVRFASHNYTIMTPFIFKYDKGNLFVICKNDNSFELKETMYVHLQKRKMGLDKSILNKDRYYIVPNSFLPDIIDIDAQFINYPKASDIVRKYDLKISEKLTRQYIVNKLNRDITENIRKRRYRKLGFCEEDFKNVSIKQYAEGVMKDFYNRGGVKENYSLKIWNGVFKDIIRYKLIGKFEERYVTFCIPVFLL